MFVGEYLGDLMMNFRFAMEDFSINNIKIINGAFWVTTEELAKFFFASIKLNLIYPFLNIQPFSYTYQKLNNIFYII